MRQKAFISEFIKKVGGIDNAGSEAITDGDSYVTSLTDKFIRIMVFVGFFSIVLIF